MFSYCIAVCISLLAIAPQDRTPAEVFAKIRSEYTGMNDASATFVQSVKHRYGKQSRSVTGYVKIKQGNKYRIENGLQTIVTDGKTVWMYNPGTTQVVIDRYRDQRMPLTPEVVLTGLPKDLTPTGVREENGWTILSLQPNKGSAPSKMFSSLDVWCKRDRWIVEKIEMKDKNNTVTVIELSDIRLNKGIDDTDFQFIVTKEMKVVRMDTP